MGKSKIFVTNSDVKIRRNSKGKIDEYGQMKVRKKDRFKLSKTNEQNKMQSAKSFEQTQTVEFGEMDFSQKVMYEQQQKLSKSFDTRYYSKAFLGNI